MEENLDLLDAVGHPFVTTTLRISVPGLEVCRVVSPRDEMLITDEAELGWDQAITAYFEKGSSAFLTYRELVTTYGSEHPAILDFGCGFGRLTRFLVAQYGASRITVADVQDAAMEFQRQTLGVQTRSSFSEASQFETSPRFDVVIASSFFTHVPMHRFEEWLPRFHEITSPDGILLFSVHDESLIPADSRDPGGFTFRNVSETNRIDLTEYGSTWVSEEFVRAAVATTCTGSHLARWPRGLSNFQDLYVLSHHALASVHLDQGPFGFFSICRLEGRELDLGGWVSHWSPGHSAALVRVSLNGVSAGSTSSFFPRPDVVALTGDARHLLSGWWCRISLPRTCSLATDVLSIVAESDSGAKTILYVGTIESALRTACQAHLRSLGEDSSIFTLLDPSELAPS